MTDRRRPMSVLAALLAVALVVAAPAFAGKKKKAAPPPSPEEIAQKMQAAATPGPHHDELKQLEGSWLAKVRMYEGPGAEPVEAEGVVNSELVFDGRYLRSEMKGEMMGQAFIGQGFDGYDNVLGKHVGVWMDSMSTGITRYEGTCDDGGKVITAFGEASDPIAGATKRIKGVTRIKTSTTYTYEHYESEDGKDWRLVMQVLYSRLPAGGR